MYVERTPSPQPDPVRNAQHAINNSNLAFSVDCVIFGYGEEGLKILLVECNLEPFIGKWSLLGDFVSHQEDLESAAYRVLKRYTGLKDIYLEQVATFGDTGRHPLGRVITSAYYALMKLHEFNIPVATDGLAVRWFPLQDVPSLAFDHGKMLASCHARLRKSLRERPIGFELLPRMFTLGQLRTLYEVVLGIELDKRNFRRKLSSLNLLVDTGITQSDVSHRPAKLYSFNHESYHEKISQGFKFEL
jgi:8-oxo-dGTP diphosphatase